MAPVTNTRAHVVTPRPINDSENLTIDETDGYAAAIQTAQPQSRRQERRERRIEAKPEILEESRELDVQESGRRIEAENEASEEEDDEPQISKNAAKKLRKLREKEARKVAKSSTALSTSDCADSSSTNPNSAESPTTSTASTSPPLPLLRTPSPTMPPTMPPFRPLFIASIGNPTPQYANTLHSTGHLIIQTLHARLSKTTHMYPFLRDRSLSKALTASPDDRILEYHIIKGFRRVTREAANAPPVFDWTLWQSPVLMNLSGRALAPAWQTWRKQKLAKDPTCMPKLVVLHDELEGALGEIKLRKQDASAKGHNGVKSIQAHMPREKYYRIGIGIGRPESRDPKVVSEYVLRKMSYREESILDRATDEVFMVLRDLYDGSRE